MIKQELMFKICVDEAQPLSLSGRLFSVYEKACFPFHDFQELLLHIDYLLDQAGRPQSSYSKRSFTESPKSCGYRYTPIISQSFDEFKDVDGTLGAFFITINTRQNATWQGTCILENDQYYEFHSDLELLHIFEKIAKLFDK